MSKLEELIQQYCPDGVEWKTLNEVVTIKRGERVTKAQLISGGQYPVISGGVKPLGNLDRYNREANTITIAQYGTAGYVDWQNSHFWANDVCYSVFPSKIVSNRFLYYVLLQNQELLYSLKTNAIPACLPLDKLTSIEIPIPPLPVQEEIVRILDTFTELQAELQAELQKRLQQYEYYRDNLIQKHCVGVEYKPLCELGTFYSGLTGKSKDDFSGGNAKFITYVNIFNHPSLETDVEEKVKIAEGEKQNTVQYGDMLFTGSSETPDECGMCSVLTHHTDEEMYLNSFCFGFRFNDLNDKSPDFMKHLFRSTDIRKKICKTANGVTRFNISKKEFAKIEIPLLPLDVQVKLAAILDRFFTLTTDLTAGLPAEIEKRKQQYEYYRDKLLTFKRITK